MLKTSECGSNTLILKVEIRMLTYVSDKMYSSFSLRIETSPSYYGDFRDKSHADGFLSYLNSLTDDLQYTIEYPSHDGSLPYMDILIHADKSTSVYRKPTHTNLYVRYNSCAPSSSKDSVIRSLTRRAHWTQSTPPPYKMDTPLTESNASWTVSNKN